MHTSVFSQIDETKAATAAAPTFSLRRRKGGQVVVQDSVPQDHEPPMKSSTPVQKTRMPTADENNNNQHNLSGNQAFFISWETPESEPKMSYDNLPKFASAGRKDSGYDGSFASTTAGAANSTLESLIGGGGGGAPSAAASATSSSSSKRLYSIKEDRFLKYGPIIVFVIVLCAAATAMIMMTSLMRPPTTGNDVTVEGLGQLNGKYRSLEFAHRKRQEAVQAEAIAEAEAAAKEAIEAVAKEEAAKEPTPEDFENLANNDDEEEKDVEGGNDILEALDLMADIKKRMDQDEKSAEASPRAVAVDQGAGNEAHQEVKVKKVAIKKSKAKNPLHKKTVAAESKMSPVQDQKKTEEQDKDNEDDPFSFR